MMELPPKCLGSSPPDLLWICRRDGGTCRAVGAQRLRRFDRAKARFPAFVRRVYAVQFATAWSSIIKGVGIVAGGPFWCAEADAYDVVTDYWGPI